jgi:hypothetical protein
MIESTKKKGKFLFRAQQTDLFIYLVLIAGRENVNPVELVFFLSL